MLKDFVVADAVAIRAQGKYVDLHNQFDLAQIRFNLKGNTAELEFVATARAASPSVVTIQFLDVDWIQLSSKALSAGSDILEIGYKEPSDNDHDWLLPEEHASAEAHLFLRLSDDEFIRLHSRQARTVL